jgi:hypothetical protein
MQERFMSKTVVGSFDSFEHARDVVAALERMGVSHGDVNLVANDAAGRLAAGRAAGDGGVTPSGADVGSLHDHELAEGTDVAGDAASAAGRGAVAGGVIGGAAGLIAGLAGLAVPGIGPLVAAGPIAATLTGAGIGAVTGGLIGGLRQVGVSDADADYYAEALRRGGALVIVRAEDDRATAIADAMRSHGAIDIESRVAAWRSAGWSGFDERAEPWTHERIESERVAYRTGGGSPAAVDRGLDHADLRSGTSTGLPVHGTTTGTNGVSGTTGSGTLGGSLGTSTGSQTGVARGSEHPNLGAGSDRPGVDVRGREHASRAGMTGGADESPSATGALRDTARRASDAIERRIPGDSDGDGR